ncbi:hypothetical protein GTA62_14810 [Roseobacter sp. HKCCD9010]|uniref:peptidoglycan recognition protein family protein n=1 Tax=unclassified Roseobacter TaxID=196798 RepID=UPI00149168C5|nr:MULTISPECIES: peptidoglycan-binding protein [unclassified Roseobacter]MBF9050618.1 hypothetical protein [Rhodobacterales bacterium HKCCD4356]NNV11964.1 hypothetical protein [Roseobacter sp. HKCCD7357]NNV16977.1 hypothetical protein [Roseobacter sp. HKCCD8768]NNV26206.1 hypothetical protein [Roseobacter sp. HKCCD8192]NNV30701.1 hypothetical protein [Roseobacter sp. HKCCD9061]
MTTNREMQIQLDRNGFDIGPHGADGIIGDDTRGAIRAFQAANGLPVDGVPDAAFMAALFGNAGATELEHDRMIYQGRARYPVNEVMVHTTATAADWWRGKTAAQMMAWVRALHTAPGWQGSPNGWRAEGYHGLIAPDGTRASGRPYEMIGAGCRERNRGVLHWALVPVVRVTRMGRFVDFYTEAQRISLHEVITEIASRTRLQRVSGHNDYAPKLCPGFKVISSGWMESARVA